MMHSSEEVWLLDDDCRGRADDHTVHGLHAAGAILGCGPTVLYLPSQTCYEFYSMTVILLCFALLLPGVKLRSASNLYQLPTGKAESTLLFGLQL